VTVDLLLRALTDPGEPPLRPLPDQVARLLRDLDAPPRLAAHLRAVHDVAHQLVDWTARRHPAPRFDRDAVLFGAATHDVGKAVHPAELSGPGSAHEEAGRELLLASTAVGAVPAPGGIGPVDAALVLTMAAFGAPMGLATATVIGYRVLTVWIPLLPGALVLSALVHREVL
jgi:hypothetical protein